MGRGSATMERQRRVVTTEQLRALVEAGAIVRLPTVVPPDEGVLERFPEEDLSRLAVPAEDNPITAVTHLREDEVQCISVDHPDHLYITDGMIPTHNTSNIIFLKSTDDSMLDTLQKMSGTRHKAYIDSKTVTRDQEKLIKGTSVEGKVSYTMNTKEEPVISYNDMAFIAERNSVVFRAGDSPIWNRNELILPMSWRLFKDTIQHPGHEYTLQTIPTLSSSMEFDVRMNQPDFEKMLDKRMQQAKKAEKVKAIYKEAYGLDDVEIARLDPDVYSEEVMSLIDSIQWSDAGGGMAEAADRASDSSGDDDVIEVDFDDYEESFTMSDAEWEADQEVQLAVAAAAAKVADMTRLVYAEGTVSKEMIMYEDGSAKPGALDKEIVEAFKAARTDMARDSEHFVLAEDGSLRGRDGELYIAAQAESESRWQMQRMAELEGKRVYAEEELSDLGSFQVQKAFYAFLGSKETWTGIARGEFDKQMGRAMRMADADLVTA